MLPVYVLGAIAVCVGFSAFFGAPYVPSRRRDMTRMFDELRPINKNDVVLDIGSGDGVVLREVSRRGAKAVGYEIHPLFVGISKVLSRTDANVRVEMTNAWLAGFPENVTLVYAFSVGRDGARLKRKLQNETNRLGRSLTLICYGNPLPRMQPDQRYEAYLLYTFQPLHLR